MIRLFSVVSDPAVLKNHDKYRNVIGSKINFNFPNLKCDVDCTNERKVTVESKNEKLKSFGVEFEFASSLLDKRGIDGTINIPIHSEDALKKISTRRYLPSRGMLLEFLKSLGSNWTKFLSCYLKVEMSCLKDFVDRDIRASLPPRVLNWSEIIRKQLKTETDAREFQEVLCLEELVQTMLRNYQTSRELFKAKAEILEILEDSEVLASDHRCSAALAPESRESLVAALLFMPIMELREAMNASFVRGKLFSPTPDVEHFIYDGELPEGEGTTVQQNGVENWLLSRICLKIHQVLRLYSMWDYSFGYSICINSRGSLWSPFIVSNLSTRLVYPISVPNFYPIRIVLRGRRSETMAFSSWKCIHWRVYKLQKSEYESKIDEYVKDEEFSRISFLRMLSSAKRSYSDIAKKKRRLILDKKFGKETSFCLKTTTSFACFGEFPTFSKFQNFDCFQILKIGAKTTWWKNRGKNNHHFISNHQQICD